MTQNAWNPHRSVAAVLSTATWHESVRLVDEVSSSNRFDGRFLIEGLDGLSIGLPVNETIAVIGPPFIGKVPLATMVVGERPKDSGETPHGAES